MGINDENVAEMACEMTVEIDREMDASMATESYFCAQNLGI